MVFTFREALLDKDLLLGRNKRLLSLLLPLGDLLSLLSLGTDRHMEGGKARERQTDRERKKQRPTVRMGKYRQVCEPLSMGR